MTLHNNNNNNNIASSNGKWYNTMVRPYIGNATISVAQREHPYYTSVLPGAYRPEQNGVQHSGPTASSSDPMDTSSLPKKRTATMAALVENPNDDDEDDEDEDDYADDSRFFEQTSEDDSDSTMNDDTDSGNGSGDEDETNEIPPATNQHHDLANITQQLNSAKTRLIEVNNKISKAEEELDRLDDDVEAVYESFPPRNIPDKLLETYSRIEKSALDERKQHAKRIYGEDINQNFQEALENAAARFAEEWVDIIKRHGDSRDRDQRINYINWQKALKEVEIEDCKRSLRSIEKDIEDLRQKAKAIKIIGRVHELGVEGIKALIATGNETLEYTFGISNSKDEECTCCD
ncbi:hypothetical protein LB507_011331 [Fusarium sp. FIESC RH6]|nr:hypothetical protein LB507_011331 [Fusarium sp. FIESC RH6]